MSPDGSAADARQGDTPTPTLDARDAPLDGGMVAPEPCTAGLVTDVTPAPRPAAWPSARVWPAMASHGDRVLLFGGLDQDREPLTDTWEWNGSAWTERHPMAHPPAGVYAMAYDGARDRFLLVGGGGPDEPQGTWEWNADAGEWTERTPGGAHPCCGYLEAVSYAGRGFGLAYDARRDRTVLFPGLGKNGLEPLTWEWNGVTGDWTPIAAEGPRFSGASTLVFDESSGRTLHFGGLVCGACEFVRALDEMWEWDGEAWSRIERSEPWPSARGGHALAYDSSRREVMLFGGACQGLGCPATPADLGHVWAWDGRARVWTDRTGPRACTSTLNRTAHGMAVDGLTGRLLVFAGMDRSVWSDQLLTWAPP